MRFTTTVATNRVIELATANQPRNYIMEFSIIRHYSFTVPGTILCKIYKGEATFGEIVGAIGHPYPDSDPHLKLVPGVSINAREMREIAGWMSEPSTNRVIKLNPTQPASRARF